MVIFLDIPPVLSFAFKVVAAVVIVLIAFRVTRVAGFFSILFLFLLSNFLLLGIIIGLYLIFKTDLIAVNNGTVYFNIGARGLLFCALIAYIVASVFVRLYNRRISKGEVYMLEIIYKEKSVKALALSDSGNKLREPFSSNSVIVISSETAGDIFDGAPFRLVPASTVNADSYLKAYKPDRVIIKNAKGSEDIENVYIAVSESLRSDKYSAVINPEILSV